jgi:hypothetical protein
MTRKEKRHKLQELKLERDNLISFLFFISQLNKLLTPPTLEPTFKSINLLPILSSNFLAGLKEAKIRSYGRILTSCDIGWLSYETVHKMAQGFQTCCKTCLKNFSFRNDDVYHFDIQLEEIKEFNQTIYSFSYARYSCLICGLEKVLAPANVLNLPAGLKWICIQYITAQN